MIRQFSLHLPQLHQSPTFPWSCWLFLKDLLSNNAFLVDLWASVSVIPGPSSLTSNGVCLLTADSYPVVCSDSRLIRLRFSCGRGAGSKVYTWSFQIAPVSVPLLEADFLQCHRLLIDIPGCKLVSANDPPYVVIHAAPIPLRQPQSLQPRPQSLRPPCLTIRLFIFAVHAF